MAIWRFLSERFVFVKLRGIFSLSFLAVDLGRCSCAAGHMRASWGGRGAERVLAGVKCSLFGKSGEKRTVKIHEKPGKNGEKRPFFIHELHRFMQH